MLDIKITVNEEEILIKVTGRIDTLTSKQFQEECLKVIDQADTLVIDMEGIEYLSSAGLRAILLLQQTQDQNNRSLKLCNVNEFVMEILDTVGFLDFLVIV